MVGHLRFLDIDICRRPDGSLGHKVYWKPTHTNLYLNARSCLHPSNIQVVLTTLLQGVGAVCDKESLHDDLEFLETTFRENGYRLKQIQCALNPAVITPKPKEKPTWVAFLPYVQTTYTWFTKCWPNTASRVLVCCLGRSPACFVWWRTTRDWGFLGYTAYCASVVRCTSDRLLDL